MQNTEESVDLKCRVVVLYTYVLFLYVIFQKNHYESMI